MQENAAKKEIAVAETREVVSEDGALRWKVPDWLGPLGQACFVEVARLCFAANTVTDRDCYMIALFASEFEQYRKMLDIVRNDLEGKPHYMLTTKQGEQMPRLHPAETARQKSVALQIKMLTTIGMSPASRNIVRALDGQGSLFDFLDGIDE